MTGRARDLVLALLAGAIAAWCGVSAYGVITDWRNPDPLPVGDRVQEAATALRGGDPVYVAADAHDRISPTDERSLEQQARASDNPVFVVVWEERGDAGYSGGYDAAYQLERVVDRDGVYVLWTAPGEGVVTQRGGKLEPSPLEDFYGDPMLRLSEIISSVDAGTRTHSDWNYWGGPGGATLVGLCIAVAAIPVTLGLVGVGRLVARRRFLMQGGWW